MPYCEQCGYKYGDGDKICGGCGAKLSVFQSQTQKSIHKENLKWYLVSAICVILLLCLITYNSNDLPFFTSHPNLPSKNIFGPYGAYVSWFLFLLFGKIIYIIPIFLLFYAVLKIKKRRLPQITEFVITALISAILLISLFLPASTAFNLTGMLSLCIFKIIPGVIGRIAVLIIVFTILAMSAFYSVKKKPIPEIARNSILTASVILILVIVSLIANAPYLFKIKEVRLEIPNNVCGELENDVYDIKGMNIFRLDTSQIYQKIITACPQISKVLITKRFPDKIVIKIKEREPIARVQAGGSSFYVDKERMLIQQNNSFANLPLISISKDENAGIQQGSICNSEQLRLALLLLDKINERGKLRGKVTAIDATSKYGDLFFVMDSGIEIKIGKKGFTEKLKILDELFSGIRISLEQIEYIDLRFKDIVIKERSKP